MGKFVSFDIEVVGHNLEKGTPDGVVVLAAIVTSDGEKRVLPYPDMREVWGILNEADMIVGANVKFDLSYVIRNGGISLEELVYKEGKLRRVWDVITVYRLMFSGLFETFSLEAIARRLLGIQLDKSTRNLFSPDNMFFGRFIVTPEMEQYCLKDAEVALQIFYKQQEILSAVPHLKKLWDEIEMPALWATFIAQDRGVCIDTELWAKMVADLSAQLDKELKAFVMTYQIDPQSPKQVVAWLRGHGKSVENASEETLLNLSKGRNSDEIQAFCRDVLKIRELAKKFSTYGENLAKHIHHPSNRIHAQFLSIGAVTGRMASNKPSLQNVPRDPSIRSLFRASPGCKLIIGDYSAQEPKIAAELSKDPTFIEIVNASDIYIQMGRSILGWDIQNKHDPRRQIVKVLLLALMYGAGPRTIAKQANITFEEAQTLTYTILRQIYHFREYTNYTKNAFIVFTLLGFPVWVVTGMDRLTALNAPIQGSGSNMIKYLCSLLLKRWPKKFGCVPPFSLFVHDEVVLDVPETEVDEAKDLVHRCALEAAKRLHPNVNSKFDIVFGDTWAEKE